jgi:N-methylhydantoinase B
MPNGTYSATDYLDNDGTIDRPIKIKLSITIKDEEMFFDFSGTDPSAKGCTNIAANTTICACHLMLKHLFPDVPVNGGCFRSLHFNIPERTVVSATHPTSVSGELEVVNRVNDLILQALVKAMPDITPAPFFGTNGATMMTAQMPQKGSVSTVLPYGGGYGGSKWEDGLLNGAVPLGGAYFPSVEVVEHLGPYLFKYYGIRENSAGAGFHRGGCGNSWAVQINAPGTKVTFLGDRADNRPQGVLGGLPGAPNSIVIHGIKGDYRLPFRSKGVVTPDEGEIIECHTPGGGGYGEPLDRDPHLVLIDVLRGMVSVESAWEDYGVRIKVGGSSESEMEYQLDMKTTQDQRAVRKTPLSKNTEE